MKINVCMHEDTEDIDLAIKSIEEKNRREEEDNQSLFDEQIDV